MADNELGLGGVQALLPLLLPGPRGGPGGAGGEGALTVLDLSLNQLGDEGAKVWGDTLTLDPQTAL